ncbi:adenylate/guanylate cyclase domain-containing protein [Ketobacter sp. MCCC 1A13808]|uniref:CHASE2 domain-containing protein n=1 Tax=Ketobacter sp. MCCC 1A13808 TaxID=2602738 RepID=UPI0012EC4B65|nr:adenylate/guanylate cyclase domain-containing protein [Ketobacter sp. MCCC 1A13808]MVF14139.1 adenylate/guanylate cyclase domain-containing protein [Ketobacter sp. MCCC 1A13808]
MRWRTIKSTGLPVLMIALLSLWSISPYGLRIEERFGLEALFWLRGPIEPPPGVVVVAITKHSAKALGLSDKLYEWSRDIHGKLVENLTQLEAGRIAFDVFFEHARDQAGDKHFERAIRGANNVFLFVRAEREFLDVGGQMEGELQTLLYPYAPFARAAIGTAPLILPKVPARVNRFYLRLPGHSERSTLHAATWLSEQANPALAAEYLASLPVMPLLNLYGPPRTITTVEFSQVIQDPSSVAELIAGATVFVGYSANQQPDQKDGFYTAFTSPQGLDISGVELAATAYANLAQGQFLKEWLPAYNGLLAFLYGLVVYYCSRRFAPLGSAIAVAGLAISMSVIVYLCFGFYQLWLPWFHTVVVMTLLCATVGMWLRSRESDFQQRLLHWAFGKYLPQEELQKLVAGKSLPDRRDYHHSVCLVTDAQGFSRLSEQLSPAALADLMQEYYYNLIPPIRQAGGIISDVAGDGVIALWPHLSPGTSWQTLHAVVKKINSNIDNFNQVHPDLQLPTRIGIHAGEIVLGHFGALDHHEFRAMGDIVNTTSRLEGANKMLGTRVLLSEECVDKEDAQLRDLGRYQFVGKNNPLRLFTLWESPEAELKGLFEKARENLEKGDLAQANEKFQCLLKRFPEDGPTQFIAGVLSEIKPDSEISHGLENGIIQFKSK